MQTDCSLALLRNVNGSRGPAQVWQYWRNAGASRHTGKATQDGGTQASEQAGGDQGRRNAASCGSGGAWGCATNA